ncbi:hypothetical protein HJG60_011878 [Phyllostomus discolor]|uniref:Uncharacterized protein n=1 Tax=Phyllostomus discolor TaxID=89673 RepID=A0A833ZLB8_9CHIR|nr:hypothetical protein HJG60_011878 [Phyllostomus discolor]
MEQGCGVLGGWQPAVGLEIGLGSEGVPLRLALQTPILTSSLASACCLSTNWGETEDFPQGGPWRGLTLVQGGAPYKVKCSGGSVRPAWAHTQACPCWVSLGSSQPLWASLSPSVKWAQQHRPQVGGRE